MKTLKTILLFICAAFSTYMFLGSLISAIVIMNTAKFVSGKTIVIGIFILFVLLFGTLSILFYRKLYLLSHHKQNKTSENNTIPEPIAPEITSNHIEPISSTSDSDVERDSVISKSDEAPSVQYVETGNVICRADGKPITDEEVPYLMQVGYEEALRKEQESTNIKFHRTYQEEELSSRFMMNHGDDIEKHTRTFENAYRQANSENNLDKKIVLLQNVIDLYEKEKKWFYRTKGGTIYFQDYYEHLHNSRNEDFSYIDPVKDDLEYILHKRDYIIPEVLRLTSSTNGIMQKDIYSYFPDEPKSDIQKIIRELENDNIISRTKKGNSYLLAITQH